MDILAYLTKKYESLNLIFYLVSTDWGKIYCNCGDKLVFTMINPPNFAFWLIETKQVPIDMLEYYDKQVDDIIKHELKFLLRDKKIKEILKSEK